jgi:hypothetical protein
VTNHVFTDLMKSKEFYSSYSAARSSRDRLSTVEKGLSTRAEFGLGLQDAVDLISGGPVAVLNNVQSVVLAPDRGSAFVAVSDVEGGKPMDGGYVEVPLDFARIGDAQSFERELVGKAAVIRPRVPTASPVAHASALYRRAARIAANDGDDDGAIPLLDQAGDSLMAGLTRLKAGRIFEGRLSLIAAIGVEKDEYRQSLARLFVARSYLAEGREKAALPHLARLAEPLARRFGGERSYGADDFRKIVLDYNNRDLYRF